MPYEIEQAGQTRNATETRGANSTTRERAAIDGALTELETRLKGLAQRIEAIDIRFGPVLRMNPPNAATGSAPMPSYGGSPLATLIGNSIETVSSLSMRLEEILARCEL